MAKRKKAQKDKQRSTIHTHKTKDGATRTPLKTPLMLRNLENSGWFFFNNLWTQWDCFVKFSDYLPLYVLFMQ